MQEENHVASQNEYATKGCANCSHPIVVHGFPTPLCEDCREKFVKFPIPVLIKVFAGIIGGVVILALFTLPKNLSAGIHLQRGKNAEKKRVYVTAENEFRKALQEQPKMVEVKAHLMITSFYNQDFQTFSNMYSDLETVSIEDEDLYMKLSKVLGKAVTYFPSDSFRSLLDIYHNTDSIPATAYTAYLAKYPEEQFAALRYASVLFDNHKYGDADSMLNIILQRDNQYISALYLKTAIKRESGEFDSAHYYSDQIIALNRESNYGMSAKARTYLRQKKDTEGLQWALKAIAISPDDPYSMATLTLAYHFNNKPGDRDKLLNDAKNDSLKSVYMKYAIDVIDGKEKFRN